MNTLLKKKPAKAPPPRAKKKKPAAQRNSQEKFSLKRLLMGEEKPDLTELESGSTTILDILSPTTVDTKSRDYIVVDSVYHAYLYVTGYGYATTAGSCWLAPLVEAGEGVNLSFIFKRQPKDKIPELAQSYHKDAIQRRLRLAGLILTAYRGYVDPFTTTTENLLHSPSLFLSAVTRSRGANPWGSTRIAAIARLGDLLCAAHYVCPGIGKMALTDELHAFTNQTARFRDARRAFLFAGESYGDILAELEASEPRTHDVDLLLPGQKPCAYFVIISAQDSAYRFLSSLFFSLALPRLSDYARLHGKNGRLPVLVNFCLDEYCNIGYMDGIADALNSIRGFNMSCQVVVQSLSQWQEKYPGKEWENQLATFDQTLYMGCNDLTSAEYISKKCGKVTISVTNNQMPLMPLFSPVYTSTRPYSQTRSNTQRDLMLPDEILRLDRRQCIALFQGHKPALLYKLAPEELPGYDTLKSCKVIDYTPEWKRREEEQAKTAPASPPAPEPQENVPTPKEAPQAESPPAAFPEYDIPDMKQGGGLSMVEIEAVRDSGDEDDDSPPGR